MLSGKKPSINSVDGACNPEAISEVFASKYETLFQGTPTEPAELQSLYRTIKSGVTADDRSYSSITACLTSAECVNHVVNIVFCKTG